MTTTEKPRRIGRGRAPGEIMQRGTCPVCQEPNIALRTDGGPHELHVAGRKHQDALRAQRRAERAARKAVAPDVRADKIPVLLGDAPNRFATVAHEVRS